MALLSDIIIILALSVLALLACSRLRVPSIIGLVIAGVVAGPRGAGLISSVHEVDTLAEIGVVLLLFTIGVEFSMRSLLKIRKLVVWGGGAQVLLTAAACYGLARLLGRPPAEAVFWGFLFAMSSTAVVLKTLQDRAELESPHGRAVLAVLIFQDLIVVPVILLIPFLAGKTGGHQSLFMLGAKVIMILALVIASAKWIVPYLLYQTARTRSREVFIITIILICLAAAWLTYSAGMSLALGAFLAGLIVSESEYNHETLGNILPFRDVFLSFFFISIGMLLDPAILWARPLLIIAAVLTILGLKAVLAGVAAVSLRLPLKTAALAGLALAQVGEFSFICSRIGLQHGLISDDLYQWFLACAVISMGLAPLAIHYAPRIADALLLLPWPEKLKSGSGIAGPAAPPGLAQHLVIIGYGVNGRNVARAARLAGIPYVIIEMNPETVRAERARGEPIHYGDASRDAVLAAAGLKNAKIAVIAINDATATRAIAAAGLSLNPRLHLIVRTRYVQEIKPLKKLGAHEVIPEEFETSVEIFSRVLARYLIPRDEIEKLAARVRSEGYEMLRSLSPAPTDLDLRAELPDVEVSAVRVPPDSSIIGKSLAMLDLRKKCGATVLAVRGKNQTVTNPAGDIIIAPGDVLFLFGPPDKISAAAQMIRSVINGSGK
ncbi:MAG TPA: cation:proton antiporter [bacterium]|nr:cation:proton antiporter [bacterium]